MSFRDKRDKRDKPGTKKGQKGQADRPSPCEGDSLIECTGDPLRVGARGHRGRVGPFVVGYNSTKKEDSKYMESSHTHTPTFQVVIHQTLEVIKPFTDWCKSSNFEYLAGQHEADDKIKRQHVHIALQGSISVEGIRKHIPKEWRGKGEYAILTQCQEKKVPYEFDPLCVYIIKGKQEIADSCITSCTKERVYEYLSAWVFTTRAPLPKNDRSPGGSKEGEKPDKTQWAIIMEARETCSKTSRIYQGEFGEAQMEGCVENSLQNFKILCAHLNKYKVRASINELERIYCTMLRQDNGNQEDLYAAVVKRIARV